LLFWKVMYRRVITLPTNDASAACPLSDSACWMSGSVCSPM